ncbi:MAG: DUF2220 family protein, partial [Propionibacteriaceae bacterium]|nr:DUF2220 family protein [Propionibacteriaceae bacterium]
MRSSRTPCCEGNAVRSVSAFRAWVRRQWRAHWPDWLAQRQEPRPWPLHPPTEAEMSADPHGVARWVADWQQAAHQDGVHVQWVDKQWRAHGVQRLPERVQATPAAMARLADEVDTWERALLAAERLGAAWPQAELGEALQATAKMLGRLEEAELVRLLAVLGWIASHPESGLWERELPVPDVHTKWVERHRSAVVALASAITGRDDTGLRRLPVRFRVRTLDPQLDSGVDDFAVDLAGLARLTWAPSHVIICENATTIGTLPSLPGVVAVHGMGFAAPTLAEVGWIRRAEQWYWGDLDTYGFQILGQLRAVLGEVRSLLMDVETLHAFSDLCVREPRPFRGEIGHLSAAERMALAHVRRGDLRLEQERIPREAAHAHVRAAL